MRLTAEKNIVYILKPADHEAGVDGDSFTMKGAAHATIILTFGAVTGDAVLKIFEGAADATKTTAKTFKYKLSSADHGAAAADQWGAEATSAALTLTAATYDNRMLAIELPAEDLTDGTPWVTLELSAAATALNASAVAILSQLRYGAGLSSIPA